MGSCFFDQFSLLHLAMGVVAYFWALPLWLWAVVHMAFEAAENSSPGMEFINTYLAGVWPGGKPRADSLLNSAGDTGFAIVGWAMAFGLDKLYGREGLYECA